LPHTPLPRRGKITQRGREASEMPLPGPLGLGTRKRAYFVMMGVCLVLIVLAWTLIWRFSILASVVMSAVALVIPPLAVIVANAGPANRQ
jgi:hypothetical protein